jgi:hypothetical protein
VQRRSVELGASLDKYVLAHVQIAETVVRPLHPLDGTFRTFRNDDHNVNVAVVMRRTPGVRTEKINLYRLKFLFQPFNGFVQKAGRNSFHGVRINITAAALKVPSGGIGRVG